MKIICEIKNKRISEKELRQTRMKMHPPILLANDPKRWDPKTMEQGKFRVEFPDVG
jgi:hypothetical protein